MQFGMPRWIGRLLMPACALTTVTVATAFWPGPHGVSVTAVESPYKARWAWIQKLVQKEDDLTRHLNHMTAIAMRDGSVGPEARARFEQHEREWLELRRSPPTLVEGMSRDFQRHLLESQHRFTKLQEDRTRLLRQLDQGDPGWAHPQLPNSAWMPPEVAKQFARGRGVAS